jgi:periplasmic copper chaperone A
MRIRYLLRALALVASLALLAGCGSDGGGIAVSDAWARTSPSMASAGAAYMLISNQGDVDDALIGASVDSSVAATVEIHETVAMGSDTTMGEMGSDTTMSGGMMSMQPVDRIELPAGESATLEPGGYHLMLLDLAEPLEAGETISITLTFEQAGEQVVEAEIRDSAP